MEPTADDGASVMTETGWRARRRHRRLSGIQLSWHGRFWYAVHRFMNWVLIGGNGYEPRIAQPPRWLYRFIAARWVPEHERYLANQAKR